MTSKTKSLDVKKITALAKDLGSKKKNYTFRLEEEVMKKFKKYCKNSKVKTTHLLETLLKEFQAED